jgi:hypothetical protein
MQRRPSGPLRLLGPALACLTWAGTAAVATQGGGGTAAMEQGVTITRTDYHGWPNSYRLSNGLIGAVVVTDIGPRIVELGPAGGPNLFYTRRAELGGSGESQWMFRGGWRLWVSPERIETTYALDNAPCTVEMIEGTTLRVTEPIQPAAGIQKRIDVTLDSDRPRLRVTSRITNVSDQAVTYAAWSLPVLRPGGRAFVPLDVGPPTSFDAIRRLILWSYTEFADPRYRFRDRLIEIDHTRVKPAPAGQAGRRDDESKIGVDSSQGWAAYHLDGNLFLKRFPHDAAGTYPDGGSTIEVYSSHEFLELEHLGPLAALQPGQAIVFPEDWWIFRDVSIPAEEGAALETLQGYVARAPFSDK